MKKIIKTAICFMIITALAACLTGCRQVYRASYNVKQEADNFGVTRRIIVMNARTDTVMLDMTGNFALTNNDTNELQITIKDAEGNFHINYIYLNDDVLYVVEDLSGADVTPYHYELNILPQMVQTFEWNLKLK